MTSPALLLALSRETMIWLAVTIILGGAAALATGRALAQSWRGRGRTTCYAALLASAACFLSFALFQVRALPLQSIAAAAMARDFATLGALLAVWAVTFVLLALIAVLGWQLTRRRMLNEQYDFLLNPGPDERA